MIIIELGNYSSFLPPKEKGELGWHVAFPQLPPIRHHTATLVQSSEERKETQYLDGFLYPFCGGGDSLPECRRQAGKVTRLETIVQKREAGKQAGAVPWGYFAPMIDFTHKI